MEDFIGFTYNGKHCIKDFGIYRTSDGSRYNDNLVPSMTDKTADVPGGDGQYFFQTTYKNREFSVSIAFDHLTEQKYREMRNWLNGREIHDLIFDEAPYKVYSAKVTGTPQLKTLCFDEEGQRIYKGEGTIQFTCYWPYAHTPDIEKQGFDGRIITNYNQEYDNIDEWKETSNIGTHTDGNNPGDIPAPFIITTSEGKSILKDTKICVGKDYLEVTILQDCTNLKWDSKSGLITGDVKLNSTDAKDTNIPIYYSGVSYGAIPVNGINFRDIYLFTVEKDNQDQDVYYKYYLDGIKQKCNPDRTAHSDSIETQENALFSIKYNYWYY